MKLITCASYYGTGSSAVTDLMSEMDNVTCKGDYEIRFIHDPYGIADLEYNIVENLNRHNSSNAIKKFIYEVDMLSGIGPWKRYEKYFQGKFKELSYEYIDNLIEFKYRGKWHFDIVEKGKFYYVLNRSYSAFCRKIFWLLRIKNERGFNLLPKNELAYCVCPGEEKFLEETKKYIDKIFEVFNTEKKEYVMVDQLVPSSNLPRYIRYFNNIKVFVVDRDPRDIYTLERMYWKGSIIPHDVNDFCEWFKWTRSMNDKEKLKNSDNVYFLQFEDLVLDYDNQISNIFNFLGNERKHHVSAKKYFDPAVSKNNTQVWKKHPEIHEQIETIEKQLKDYCYEF